MRRQDFSQRVFEVVKMRATEYQRRKVCEVNALQLRAQVIFDVRRIEFLPLREFDKLRQSFKFGEFPRMKPFDKSTDFSPVTVIAVAATKTFLPGNVSNATFNAGSIPIIGKEYFFRMSRTATEVAVLHATTIAETFCAVKNLNASSTNFKTSARDIVP